MHFWGWQRNIFRVILGNVFTQLCRGPADALPFCMPCHKMIHSRNLGSLLLCSAAQSLLLFLASKKKSWVQQPRQQQPGTFACNFCGYETSVEFDLYRHIRDEHAILNLAEAAAPDAAAPAAVAIQKTAVTAQEEDDLPPPPPPNVVTLDEAGLRSGKISIVCE